MHFLLSNTKKRIWILNISLLLIFESQSGIAQSLTGTTGLVNIPTADILQDGQIYFGVGFVNKKYNTWISDEFHQTAYFVTIGFLPFMEVSLRLTRLLRYGDNALGDRMASIRLRLLKEHEFYPSLVLGAHDFTSAFGIDMFNNFNTLYLVTSKHIQIESFLQKIGFHLGYDTNWIKAVQHQFIGVLEG